MKRTLFVMLTLFLLAGCGGKQLVWVDVAEVSETAVPQPIAPEEEVVIAATAVPTTSADDGMMAEMDGGMMGGGVVDTAVSQIQESLDEALAQDDDDVSDEAARAIQLLAEEPEVAGWLASYPDWTGDAWLEGEDGLHYHVDLYSAAADEWLGWGYVNVADGVVEDFFVPRELTAEEFQTGREMVEAFVFSDEEVLARLGNVDDWSYDTWYNRWDANWQVWFWYGLEELAVTVNIWEDEPYLDSITNPAEFEAEEAAENSKNQAIELAWQAEGIDQAVAGVDNWQTYVAQQGDTVWAVTFATEDRELFYALVDIGSWTVLESSN
ncbi:MAG: hypothetical protein IT327_18155 [Anaerolineae bacterium]|nr:hypothetical protein [Anaerolineae bacterium]